VGPSPGAAPWRQPHAAGLFQTQPQDLADLGDAWLAWQIALLKGNRWPLSGDVTQWIKTWGEIVGQVGLVNYNIAGSTDPMAEKRIGSEYSYGRQLGRILDVLVPVVKAHEADFKLTRAREGAEVRLPPNFGVHSSAGESRNRSRE
jgi:hypothetical protein